MNSIDVLQNCFDLFRVCVGTPLRFTTLSSLHIDKKDGEGLDRRTFKTGTKSYLIWQCRPIKERFLTTDDCRQKLAFVKESGCDVQNVFMTAIASFELTEQTPNSLTAVLPPLKLQKNIRIDFVGLHFHVTDQRRVKVFGYIIWQIERVDGSELFWISTKDNGSVFICQTSKRDPDF